MAKLAVHQSFMQDLVRLPRPVQEKVAGVFDKFAAATHAGLHLEKVDNAKDGRLQTIRVDKFWRGVVLAPDSGDTYTLLKVLPHDDAYTWIRRRQVSVNMTNGQIELRDVVAIEATVPALDRKAEKAERRLFEHHSDATLRRLGLDDQILAFARVVTDEEQLENNRSYLPPSQYDVMCGLAAGMSPEDVWAEMVGDLEPDGFDEADLDAAVERSAGRILLVDGPEELMKVFRDPFAMWRIYLHPTQHRVAHAAFRGSAQVTGGPGTGKTVVCLHRARELAERGGSVLLTTFTTTLAHAVDEQLQLLIQDDEILDRIDVRHVDQVARQVVTKAHGRPTILSPDEERQVWRHVIRDLNVPYNERFLSEEWRQVVLAQNISDLDAYLVARRAGRGRGLRHLQRAKVWEAICAFTAELSRRQVWTYETVCAEAACLLSADAHKPYDHVIVDEAQDLHPVRWRLLRAAVAEGCDDIFLAADTHQRIYDNHVSLRSVGVDVAGRSTRLTMNYRTTAEILAWSLGMLAGDSICDMDGTPTSLAGCRSEVHGRPPEVAGTATRQEELHLLAGKVRSWLDAGVEPNDIGIAGRTHMQVSEAVDELRKVGIDAVALSRDPALAGHVQVATMHRMKGLEFRCVAVIGIGKDEIPLPRSVTPLEEDELTHLRDLQRERCVLFVACTRAREELYVSWHGPPSPFLPADKQTRRPVAST
jgi:superfamily I DNA/RNA helicase